MLQILIQNEVELKRFDHEAGPLELGRGPKVECERYVVSDPFMSRDHVRLEELEDNRVRVQNLSSRRVLEVDGADPVETGGGREVELPATMIAGKTRIEVRRSWPVQEPIGATTRKILRGDLRRALDAPQLPDVETLGRWFETVISVQQSAADSPDFYQDTARAVVNLVGLDRGLVLVRAVPDWKVVALHAADDRSGPNYSRSIVEQVFEHGSTFCRRLAADELRESLANVETVVAAPVLDRSNNVMGVVYGARLQGDYAGRSEISPLESKLVEVLAAAVGAGLARQRKQEDAEQLQRQFEQFVSPQVARELARDPQLLDGREREITVLFSDVRNSTVIAEKLGPRETFRLMQDVMDLQSSCVRDFDGSVVDYVGDGLIAMWNAPLNQDDHAELACRAVLAFMQELPELSHRWMDVLGQPLELGVGLNTGMALVGNSGSRFKLKYGPMGTTVNVASRVENATKRLGVPILITEETQKRISPDFAMRRLCQASLVGVAEPLTLYELFAAEKSAAWTKRCEAFEEALEHFEAGRWTNACEAIYPLITDKKGHYDIPSLNLLARAVDCIRSKPDPFDPVIYFSSKR